MSYTVLARRYRSRTFDELVGQEPIARTLENAIAADRIAHAYLFCGTRGVGKTSLARIFASAMNVTDDLGEADAIREAIFRGDDLDVIEIDGASNRGIQEARDLIAGAGLSPARCRFKIYIIDEVHMLTKEAFNALLKTMEEPPAHVKFILCTTDPEKVPATIQSRCQRFDFRAIPTERIAEQLRGILGEEGVKADDALVMEVARLGRGSMRDALSLLDRLLASGDEELTLEAAGALLGLPDRAVVITILDAVIARDPAAALEAGAELLARGATVERGLEMIVEHLRALMLITACGPDATLVELEPAAMEVAVRQSAAFDLAGLVYLIAVGDAVARNARGSATARALFDAALVRLCLSEHLADVAGLLAGDGGVATPPAAPVEKKKRVAAPDSGPPRAAVTAPVLRAAAPVVSASVPAPSAPAPADARANAVSDDDVWPTALAFAARSPALEAKVRHVRLIGFDGRTVRLEVHAESASSARFIRMQQEAIADLVRKATGRAVKVEISDAAAETEADTDAAASTPSGSAMSAEEARRLPGVAEAIELFDARVVDVRDD